MEMACVSQNRLTFNSKSPEIFEDFYRTITGKIDYMIPSSKNRCKYSTRSEISEDLDS